jgi:hypothetical protein
MTLVRLKRREIVQVSGIGESVQIYQRLTYRLDPVEHEITPDEARSAGD